LLTVCLDLFLAGTKTTSDNLVNAFLFLSLNPEWVKILQEELDRVVGKSRAPTESDLPFLPKMEAFLTEVINLSDETR
jgi:cytochrome P450